MRPSPISILLDSNERGSDRAKALALAVGGDPAYELAGFAELPVDLQFHLHKECKKYEQDVACEPCSMGPCVQDFRVNVELKEIHDFWQSKNTGHLGQQCLEMIAHGSPGFIAVFGSLQEVLESVPKMKMWENTSGCKKPQRRSQMDIQSDISTARAFCADATACGVPLFFLSTNHKQSFAWILSMAKNILTGPNLSSWLPRYPVEPRGYGVLCSIKNVGDVTAKKACLDIGPFNQLPWKGITQDNLAVSLGKSKAKTICNTFGVE